MKFLPHILILIIIFLFFIFFKSIINNDLKNISQICISGNCFDVEVMDTIQKRESGMMNKKDLASNRGMFFVFKKEGFYDFWMKDTLISLDIIWIDENYQIVNIKNNVQPCKISQCEFFKSEKKAKYVLEIKGGLTEDLRFKVGDKIELYKR